MLAVAIAGAVIVAVAPLRVQIGYDVEDMRQGNLISEAIKAHDSRIDVAWESGARLLSYSYGGPVITLDSPIQGSRMPSYREFASSGSSALSRAKSA